MTELNPVEERQRETILEIMTELDPEGRQRERNLEIMTELHPVEGRQREIKADKPGNHVETKSFSLQEKRTPAAEDVWGKKRFDHKWLLCFPYQNGILGHHSFSMMALASSPNAAIDLAGFIKMGSVCSRLLDWSKSDVAEAM